MCTRDDGLVLAPDDGLWVMLGIQTFKYSVYNMYNLDNRNSIKTHRLLRAIS